MRPSNDAIARELAGKDDARLLNAFFVLYKTARIVDENNDVFRNQLGAFLKLVRSVGADRDEVVLKLVSGHYFVNDKMAAFDDKGLSGAADVVREWQKLGIGGVRFSAAITDEHLGRFFKFITGQRVDDNNVEKVAQALAEADIDEVHLLSAKLAEAASTTDGEDKRRQFRAGARQVFFNSMTAVKELIVNTGQNQDISIAKTKRVVHSLIDQITRDEQSMIELTSIRDYDDYTYAHSVNITVYSLTVGIRLKLDRARLSQLGFSALFHDIGKVKLPQDLIRKPDAYDENDWVQMQRHPALGVKTILRNMDLNVHTARAARAAFEHHINADFTGYPMLHYKKREPDLFSKIISIVDTFDALTSGRVYLRKALPPDVVLRKMRHQMTTKFDAFLLKLFNDIIGIYPAGTLVLMTTDEIALILTNNQDHPARPYIKIVGNREGLLETPLWVDLTLPEHADRGIVRRIDPAHYGLNVRDFVLGD